MESKWQVTLRQDIVRSSKSGVHTLISTIDNVAGKIKEEMPKSVFHFRSTDQFFGQYEMTASPVIAEMVATFSEVARVKPVDSMFSKFIVELDLCTPEAKREWRRNMVITLEEWLLDEDFRGFKILSDGRLRVTCTERAAALMEMASHVKSVVLFRSDSAK